MTFLYHGHMPDITAQNDNKTPGCWGLIPALELHDDGNIASKLGMLATNAGQQVIDKIQLLPDARRAQATLYCFNSHGVVIGQCDMQMRTLHLMMHMLHQGMDRSLVSQAQALMSMRLMDVARSHGLPLPEAAAQRLACALSDMQMQHSASAYAGNRR